MLELQFDNRRGETLLRYGQDAEAPVLMAWPGDSGQFVFVDADHAEQDRWPPAMAKNPTAVPFAVRLEARREGKLWVLWAVPTGPDKAPSRLRDMFGSATQ